TARGNAPAPAPAPAPAQARGRGGPAGGGSSEDCLYLNVWTPAKAANERLPVMVWIYGGGFVGGSTSGALTTGERLAGKGVIVVSIAYRVGPLGYLAHPGLSAESTARVSGTHAAGAPPGCAWRSPRRGTGTGKAPLPAVRAERREIATPVGVAGRPGNNA